MLFPLVMRSRIYPIENYYIEGFKVTEEQYLKWNEKLLYEISNDQEFIELKQQKYKECLRKNIDVVCEKFKK